MSKRFLMLFFLVFQIVIVSAFYSSQSIAAVSIVYGDVNEDGSVNSTDLALVKRYILGMISIFPSDNGLIAADVNGDSSVNSIDLAYLKKYLIGLIRKFPVEETVISPSLTPTVSNSITPTKTPIPTPTKTPVPTPTQSDYNGNVPANNPGVRESNGSNHVMPDANAVTGKTIEISATEDDAAKAIETALKSANAGDEILLKNGTYNLKSAPDGKHNIVLKSKVNIRGESKDGVILKSSLNAGTNLSSDYHVIYGNGVTGVKISNVTVTSAFNGEYSTNSSTNNPNAGGPTYGITLKLSNNVYLENVLVEKFLRFGLRIDDSSEVTADKLEAQNATDVGGGGAGYAIDIQGSKAKYNIIKNAKVMGPYIRHGVIIQYSANHNLVTNSSFKDTQLDSIDFHGEDEYLNEASYNRIENAKESGVGVGNSGATHDKAGPGNWIHHNTLVNCKNGITVVFGSEDTVIESNNISKSSSNAINIGNGPNTVIKKNTITDSNVGIRLFKDPGLSGKPETAGAPKNVTIKDNILNNNKTAFKLEAGDYTKINNLVNGKVE